MDNNIYPTQKSFKDKHFGIKYYPSLDGLRALSILIVITAHFSHTYKYFEKYPLINLIIGHGNLGVAIFFSISGFLITTLLIKERERSGEINLARFYVRRALRILPVLFLFLLSMLFLNYLFQLRISSTSFWGPMLFLGNVRKFNQSIYFSHFWSLAYEEQFYFVIPFLLKYKLRAYFTALRLYLLMMPIIIFLYGSSSFSSESLSHLLRYFYNFYPLCVGSFFALLINNNQFDKKAKLLEFRFLPYLLLILVFALNFKLVGNVKDQYIDVLLNFLNSYIISIFIIICMHLTERNIVYKVLNWKVFVKIGILSYSLYVFQQIFTTQIPWKGFSQITDGPLFNLLGTFIVASLSYYLYEKRFLKMKDKFGH